MISEFYWLKSGYCKSIGKFTNPQDTYKMRRYYAYFGLLKHENLGWILFDTGYSSHYSIAVKKFPNRILDLMVPVTLGDDTLTLINTIVPAENISFIIVSHLHADHIGGLKQFNEAQIIMHNQAYQQYCMEYGFKALKNAFIRGLLPQNLDPRTRIIECNTPFNQVFMCKTKINLFLLDLFSDKSIYILKLDGHSPGMIGLLFNINNSFKLLCSDALYNIESLQTRKLGFAQKIIGGTRKDVNKTFQELLKIHEAFPDWQFIPSHCDSAAELINAKTNT